MISELLLSNRSFRRFDESYEISKKILVRLTEAIRLSPSAGNLQRVRVLYVTDKEERAKVFDTLAFAAYLKDWDGPEEGQRPRAKQYSFNRYRTCCTVAFAVCKRAGTRRLYLRQLLQRKAF